MIIVVPIYPPFASPSDSLKDFLSLFVAKKVNGVRHVRFPSHLGVLTAADSLYLKGLFG